MENEDFAYLVEKNGVPAKAESCDSGMAAAWRGRMPSGLIELWERYGIGMWGKGKFQFCRPERYAGLVRMILDGDPVFQPEETHLYGFSAFGKLLLWNEKVECLHIDLVYLRARADVTAEDWTPTEDTNFAIAPTMMNVNRDNSFTLFENTPSAPPLFKKCLKTYGELELGECYGLFPALPLGGSTDLASIKRVKALEHFSFLAQLDRISLVNFMNGQEKFIRYLGA